jgi:DNA repair protein RadD
LLYDFQAEIVGRIYQEIIADRRRGIVISPTGSGKTVIAGAVIAAAVDRGERALILSHRREITIQTSRKLWAAGVQDHGILQAGFSPLPSAPVQVASIQTLHARAIRSRSIELPAADLIVLDECHHAPAATYRRLLEKYPNVPIIGLTATPTRADGRGLGGIFDVLLESPQVAELITGKYLVGTRVYAPTRPDLTGVRVEHGDYVERQLDERMNTAKLVGDIVEHWHRLADRRRTVGFATSVAHSVHLRDEFRRSGVLAEHIDGSTPLDERAAILAKLAAGTIEVVTNCMVLTEGWDQPEVSCIILARPTKHMGLYRQMVGRVLRTAPNKDYALVLDHAGAVFQHGFVEEPVIWTLDPDRRAENPVHSSRGEYGAPVLTTCPECSAVRFEGRPCVVCGWHPVTKPKPVRVADGDLGEVDRRGCVRSLDMDRRAFHRQLTWIACERGYSRAGPHTNSKKSSALSHPSAQSIRYRPRRRPVLGFALVRSPTQRRRQLHEHGHHRARSRPVARNPAAARHRYEISLQQAWTMPALRRARSVPVRRSRWHRIVLLQSMRSWSRHASASEEARLGSQDGMRRSRQDNRLGRSEGGSIIALRRSRTTAEANGAHAHGSQSAGSRRELSRAAWACRYLASAARTSEPPILR